MPRLRQTNTLITDRSQISIGDFLAFRATTGMDGIGRVCLGSYVAYILVDDCEHGLWHYAITNMMINNGRYIKISSYTLCQIQSEQEEYYDRNATLVGYKTGLFPCQD